jgi:chromosomal replication initiation ATPase DnaA
MREPQSVDLSRLAETYTNPESMRDSRQSRRLQTYKKPINRYFPNKERNLRKIDPPLYDLLRTLANGDGKWPLFLWGKAGVGKTCAALALCDHSLGEYMTAADLAEAAIREMKSDHGSLAEFWKLLAGKNLVVLDEIGAQQKVTDHHQTSVKRLLDCRENKPTIVIANIDLEAVAVIYGDPVASRLAGGTVFHLDGPDRRLTHD